MATSVAKQAPADVVAALSELEDQVASSREAMRQAWRAIRKSRWVHLEGPWGRPDSPVPRNAYEALREREGESYDKADRLFVIGEQRRGQAEQAERELARRWVELAHAAELARGPALRRVVDATQILVDECDRAGQAFAQGERLYRQLQRRYQERLGFDRYFEGYRQELPADRAAGV